MTLNTHPDGEPDYARVLELALSAAHATLRLLHGVEVEQRVAIVFREHNDGIGSVPVSLSSYRSDSVWNRIDEIWAGPETIALTDYLWSHDSFKRAFIDSDGDARVWARAAFGSLIHLALLDALRRRSIETAIAGEAVEPWRIDREYVDEAVRARILQLEETRANRDTFIAYCPLADLELPASFDVDFGHGIHVRQWRVLERLLFMTEHGDEYLWDDFKSPLTRQSLAQIQLTVPHRTSERHASAKELSDRLDLLKWAIFVATDASKVLGEGKCLILNRTGHIETRLHRDDRTEWVHVPITDQLVDRCRGLVDGFINAAATHPDLWRGLWHFGRAGVAVLNRDALLEAAIGLDAMLVPGGPESRYRFCLHGSMLLSRSVEDADAVWKNLQEIYSKRSAAAHGSVSQQYEPWTVIARQYLSKVIAELVRLHIAGALPNGKDVANRVQRLVFNRVNASPAPPTLDQSYLSPDSGGV